MVIKRISVYVCVLLFVAIFSLFTYLSINHSEGIYFLQDLDAGDKESLLKSKTAPPKKISVDYVIQETSYHADLYTPQKPPLASIVLIPGVAEQGKDDVRLIAFATTLTRSRFMVLVPDISNLRELKVRAEDSHAITHAITYLMSHPELPPQTQVGIGAFSYAVGPAILAALNKNVRNKVDFILSVGGYYDVEQVITFFTTGYYKKNEGWQYKKPNEYGKWVFVLSNIERLSNLNDKTIFYEIAQRKMDNPNSSINDLTSKLTAEAASILTLLNNQDQNQTNNLIKDIPDTIRKDLNELDLSNKDLSHLKAKLILLHGINDDIIPYTESIALARAVKKGQAKLFIIDGLAHVDVHPNLLNQWKLLRAVEALLDLRKVESEN